MRSGRGGNLLGDVASAAAASAASAVASPSARKVSHSDNQIPPKRFSKNTQAKVMEKVHENVEARQNLLIVSPTLLALQASLSAESLPEDLHSLPLEELKAVCAAHGFVARGRTKGQVLREIEGRLHKDKAMPAPLLLTAGGGGDGGGGAAAASGGSSGRSGAAKDDVVDLVSSDEDEGSDTGDSDFEVE